MRLLALAASVLLAACASGGSQPATTPSGATPDPAADGAATTGAGRGPATSGSTVYDRTRVDVVGKQEMVVDMTVARQRFVSATTIGKPIDQVWGVLPEIWTALGLSAEGISSSEHRLVTGNMRIRRQLGGVSLSRFLDCGRTAMGPNADSYFITLKVETILVSAGSNTIVQSALVATGEGTGNGGSTTHCSTTGELENRIGDRLLKRASM
ncbi:MAG: hypothetical protein HY275_12065 [Gemmatimonadetes bacterium]|nr:hypothetical protein [Gemmatimonadota bacterium]